MDVNGIRVLVDLLTLAHLHTSRATVPLQVIKIRVFDSLKTCGGEGLAALRVSLSTELHLEFLSFVILLSCS